MQYCSFKDPYSAGEVNPLRNGAGARAKAVMAHLTLDAARVDSMAAGSDTLFEKLAEQRLMQGFLALRGESR